MKRIAIFASGGGSNALKILEYFDTKLDREVSLIITNNESAGVLGHANKFNVPTFTISKDSFYNSEDVVQDLKNAKVDLIVLAGFLWLVPGYLIDAFPNKIINIHPALLPKYGGKGMYGMHVHNAVKLAGDKVSGITIHYVNGKYDDGKHIFQDTCDIEETDTPEQIAKKVLSLEHKNFPWVIDKVLESQILI